MTMGHRLRSGSPRRGLAMIAATALLTSLLAVPAFSEHRANTTTLEGDNAVDAALAWSADTFTTASAVAIGRNDVFADNLASGLIQGLGTGVPLLLTDSTTLDPKVKAEITRLGATAAHVLGGVSAISAAVEAELVASGLTVHRHAGASRVETAVDIASKHGAAATTALLARSEKAAGSADESQAFADALGAGAWAAEADVPVLLTQTGSLHPAVAEYLENSAVTDVVIIGGTAAISSGVESALTAMGLTVDRVRGATRFETAVAINNERGFDTAADAPETILVEGQSAVSWAGGFAGAAAAALNGSPVVLSNGDALPAATSAFLAGALGLVCGPMVNDAACTAAGVAAGFALVPHTNQTFTVTPADAVTNSVSEGTTTNANRGARTYTVAGLDNAKDYNLELHEAQDVVVTDGQVAFKNATRIAAAATAPAIEVVNGAGIGTAGTGTGVTQVNDVKPINGQITLSVDSTVADEVIPVVYEDTTNDATNALDLVAGATSTNPTAPTEPFAIGGRVDWIPAEATLFSNVTGGEVIAVYPTMQAFSLDNAGADGVADVLVKWATGDTASSDNDDTNDAAEQAINLAQFTAWLSAGDILGGITGYNPGTSAFLLNADFPAAPTGVAASLSSGTVTVTFTKPTNLISTLAANDEAYQLQRATVTAGVVGAYANVGAAILGNATASIADAPGTAGTYSYRVVADGTDGANPNAGSTANRSAAVEITIAAAALTPASIGKSYTDNDSAGGGAANNLLDTGDKLSFAFDRAVTVSGTWSVNLVDTDGTEVILNQTNSAAAVSGTGGNIVTITVSTAPIVDEFGGNGTFDTAAEVQVVSAIGIGNTTGAWNVPKSGLAANAGRMVVGTAPAVMTVTSATAGTSTIVIPAAAGQADADTVLVYNANGTQIGSHVVAGGETAAGFSFTTTTGFTAGDTLYVLYLDDSSNAAGQDLFSVTASVTAA